jgi:hypothetical protein
MRTHNCIRLVLLLVILICATESFVFADCEVAILDFESLRVVDSNTNTHCRLFVFRGRHDC